jgi:hypothetical protein
MSEHGVISWGNFSGLVEALAGRCSPIHLIHAVGGALFASAVSTLVMTNNDGFPILKQAAVGVMSGIGQLDFRLLQQNTAVLMDAFSGGQRLASEFIRAAQ